MNLEYEVMSIQQARELNPLVLAYIGDAVYEVHIRQSLVLTCPGKAHELHKKSIRFASAVGQSQAVEEVLPLLTEEETAIYRRGRNSKSATMPKHAGVMEYRRATGLESVFGYLYLTGQTERLRELIRVALAAEEHQEKGTDEHE